MNIIQVKNENDLDILKGKEASFEQLKFDFSDKYIQSLKNNLDLKNSVQFIMKDGDNFCGYLAGYEHEFWPDYLYLRELFIDPNYQGQGIGSKLVSQFIEKAKELNLKGAMTQTEFENIPAQKLYEKMGFLKIENKDWNEGVTYRLSFNNETHNKNISFLKKYLNESKFDWINYNLPLDVSYFSSGGGTHLYLIQNGDNKFLARINFYPGKNDWKVKRAEFETLKEIEHLSISPKAYVLNENNELKQDLTIVEYIEGGNIIEFSESDIILLAKDFKKLHNFPKQYKEQDLPYKCSIYNEFANGEDKKIEKYNFQDIKQVFLKYNSIKEDLGKWFNNLSIFDKCENLCLCHGDLKSENILKTDKGIMLIDWECADIDIPETDIGRLFSGCSFTKEQQNIFLKEYYENIPSGDIINRISSIKIVLDFFRIIENYCILKRKVFDAKEMLNDLEKYENELNTIKEKICP